MDNLQLRVIASYLNAKVECDGEAWDILGVSNSGMVILTHPMIQKARYRRLDTGDYTLLLRSLDDMKEEEAKEYAKCFSINNGHIATYSDLLYLSRTAINTDWIRSKNFITDFEGKDIIELGFAKIDNEAYE